jgi:hypothetical protein
VADSGGNDIYTIDPATGEINLLAVIPGLPAADGAPNPARGGAAEVDPVPTDVVADPNGGVFVGLLPGAALWGTPGSAKVIHVDPDGTITDVATGLNTVVGVAVDGNSSLYASQLSANLLAQPPAPGSVALANDAAPEDVVIGLTAPYGIAFGPEGSLYVAINASAPSGTPAQGQVLKCTVPAVVSPTPAATTPPASPSAAPTTEPSPTEPPPTTEPTPTEPTPTATEEPSASPAPSVEATNTPEASSTP